MNQLSLNLRLRLSKSAGGFSLGACLTFEKIKYVQWLAAGELCLLLTLFL